MANIVEIVSKRYGKVTGEHREGEAHFLLFFKSKRAFNKFIKETSFMFSNYYTQTCYELLDITEDGQDVWGSKIENYKIVGELKKMV